MIKALEKHRFFDSVAHILCRWHVSMNVLAKTKRFFPKARFDASNRRTVRVATFQEFLNDWNQLVNSTTEAIFEQRLASFREPGKHNAQAVSYAVNTWIQPWKEKLVSAWVDQIRHFGHTTTSVIESLHAGIKRYLQTSRGDLATVYSHLRLSEN